jgi:hypothetical protein
MNAEVLLTDAEWERIAADCPSLTDDLRPSISSFISIYRRLPQYKELEWRYDEAATLARKTGELIKRIERYRNDAAVPESLRLEWQENVKGLDKLADALALWTERFQETERRGKLELKAARDSMQTLIGYLRFIMGGLDRSKEVERFVATVLEIADPGTKKKDIGWQIRRSIDWWQRFEQEHYDETLTNMSKDPRVQESMKQLSPIWEPKRSDRSAGPRGSIGEWLAGRAGFRPSDRLKFRLLGRRLRCIMPVDGHFYCVYLDGAGSTSERLVPRGGMEQACNFNSLRLPTRAKPSVELQWLPRTFPDPDMAFPSQYCSARTVECDSHFGHGFDSPSTPLR